MKYKRTSETRNVKIKSHIANSKRWLTNMVCILIFTTLFVTPRKGSSYLDRFCRWASGDNQLDKCTGNFPGSSCIRADTYLWFHIHQYLWKRNASGLFEPAVELRYFFVHRSVWAELVEVFCTLFSDGLNV